MKNMTKYFTIFFISLLFLAFFIKGDAGNPIAFQNELISTVGSPFESTNSTSRYALTKSIVEDGSVFLNENLARSSAPDLVRYNSKFISIFTPGVSFIAIPFYLLGQLFNMPQVFTYMMNLLATVMSAFLIAAVARRIGANEGPAIFAGFVYLFASNALAYGLTFTQHPLSVAILLLSFLIINGRLGLSKSIALGALTGIGILVDLPNLIMLFPLVLYHIIRHFQLAKTAKKSHVSINLRFFALILGLLPFIFGFALYNYQTTGSYTLIGQTIGRTNYFDTKAKKDLDAKKEQEYQKSSTPRSNLPFHTRDQINSFYTLLISNERAWIYYSPVVLFGFLGVLYAYRKKETQVASLLIFATILTNITIYGMFPDPWGGWSFGPRYLLPAAAFLCAGLGVAISIYLRRILFFIPFLIALIFSITISTAGALTTSAIPPKVEALALSPQVHYTSKLNFQILSNNNSSSLIYNIFASRFMNANQYFLIIVISLSSIATAYTLALFIKSRPKGVKAI